MTGDLFDAALHLESQHIAEGYEEGLRCAMPRVLAPPPHLAPLPPAQSPLTAAAPAAAAGMVGAAAMQRAGR